MHPYKKFPPQNFWNQTVATKRWEEIEFKSDPRFRISNKQRVSTAGSCFAQHIARNLSTIGLQHYVTEKAPTLLPAELAKRLQYGSFSARYGNIYTAKQLRQLIEFAYGKVEPVYLFHEAETGIFDLLRPHLKDFPYKDVHDLICDRTYHLQCVKEIFDNAEIFIFTLGLTEHWFDQPTDIAFPVCPGTVVGVFDSDRHKFRNSTYEEIVSDLDWCINFVKEINPKLNWIFTVSPVALAATAQNQNVVLSTVASKSVLRTAVENVFSNHLNTEYFPSFEITSYVASFGKYLSPDCRNISTDGVDHAMREFSRCFTNQINTATRFNSEHVDIREKVRQAIDVECDETFNDPDT